MLGPRSPLDEALTAPVSGGTFTLRGLFKALRALGVEPHPGGSSLDEEVASYVLGSAAVRASGGGEGAVEPSPWLAMDEGWFTRVYGTTNGGAPPAFQYNSRRVSGTFSQLTADLDRMGVGRARRLNQSDVYYAALFPYDEDDGNFHECGAKVPRPADLLTALRDDGYRRLGPTLLAMTAALTRGVRLDLTPFNAGGGGPQNLAADEDAGTQILISGNRGSATHQPETKADLLLGGPRWQTGFLIPSGEGWDAWYWDHTSGHSALEEVHQRFAINVWPTRAGQAASEAQVSAYRLECARRKGLGVAAFSAGLGEWLAKVDEALRNCGAGALTDVVDTIELCNETDSYFALPDWQPPGPGGGAPGVTQADVVRDGAREAGAYLALVAGPIAAQVPGVRFRTELNTWHGVAANNRLVPVPTGGGSTAVPGRVDNFEQQLQWLHDVVRFGMEGEVRRWREVASARTGSTGGGHVPGAGRTGFGARLPALRPAESDGSFTWPPEDPASVPAATALLHQVGFHFFHDWNINSQGNASVIQYADSVRMAHDFERLRGRVLRPLTAAGFTLEPTLGAMSFPGFDPSKYQPPHTPPPRVPYYDFTDERLQAGMHLRLASTAIACGAKLVGVYTYLRGPLACRGVAPKWAPSSWLRFGAAGVRNDLYGKGTTFDKAADAWPRPSWFTFRRLNWLLGKVEVNSDGSPALRLALNHRGLTVIEFPFREPLADGPTGEALGGSWARGYLIWLDQYANDIRLHWTPASLRSGSASLRVEDPTDTGYELLPMVPAAAYAGTSPDRNGYASPTRPMDYRWAGWDSAVRPLASRSSGEFRVRINRCAPPTTTALVPAVVLTNGTLRGEV